MFTAGTVCRVKRFTTSREILSQGCSKVADDARPGAEVAETTAEVYCAAGFNALIK
jgi:hypothetical protein